MADKQIRIIPKRREVADAERLAAALLDLVDHLSPEDKAHYVAEGERVLGKTKGGARAKGSAA